jgi:hypothetical protein
MRVSNRELRRCAAQHRATASDIFGAARFWSIFPAEATEKNEGGTRAALIDQPTNIHFGLAGNHRHDSECAGIHDQNFIANQNILIVLILRRIIHDPSWQSVKMNRSRNGLTDQD